MEREVKANVGNMEVHKLQKKWASAITTLAAWNKTERNLRYA